MHFHWSATTILCCRLALADGRLLTCLALRAFLLVLALLLLLILLIGVSLAFVSFRSASLSHSRTIIVAEQRVEFCLFNFTS